MSTTRSSMNLRTKRGPLTDISNQHNENEDQNNTKPKRAVCIINIKFLTP